MLQDLAIRFPACAACMLCTTASPWLCGQISGGNGGHVRSGRHSADPARSQTAARHPSMRGEMAGLSRASHLRVQKPVIHG